MSPRDHRRTHARRNELARERGFGSFYEQTKAPKRITGPKTLGRLPARAQRERQEALKVVALMRRDDLDLRSAARREHVPVQVVQFYAGEALTDRGARARAKSADRLYRRMTIISGGRLVEVDVRGSRQASLVSDFWNTGIYPYFEPDSDASGLARFSGRSVGGFEFETDLDRLDELARSGDLSFEDIYRLVT